MTQILQISPATSNRTATQWMPRSVALREYQRLAISQTYRWFRQGKKSILLVMPTGSGKTFTAIKMIEDARSRGCRVLFLCHRAELIRQTVDSLIAFGIPAIDIATITPDSSPIGDERIIVASLQTLQNREYPPGVGLVIFDEAHTTAYWPSSQKLIRHYMQAPVMELSRTKFIGLTASPFRTKRKEYLAMNGTQAIVQPCRFPDLVAEGSLVQPRYFGFGGVDVSKLGTGGDGDYKQSQVQALCMDDEFIETVATTIATEAADRKTILFNASVAQAIATADRLNELGYRTEAITGDTTAEERRAIYARFKSGETLCLSSIDVLCEGFDERSCDCVAIARPTKSKARYVQMVGRGLRPFPGKSDCLVLDFGQCTQRLGFAHELLDAPVSLCPGEIRAMPTKECPSCHELLPTFTRVCPHCGHEFEGEPPPDEPIDFEDEWGELLSRELVRCIGKVRGQRKRRYTQNLAPDGYWDTWEKVAGKEYGYAPIFQNDWLFAAVFGRADTEGNRQRFLHYLHSFSDTRHWIDHHFRVEFERAGAIGKAPPPMSWRDVLGDCGTLEALKFSYGSSMPETESDLLNWAYDAGKHEILGGAE